MCITKHVSSQRFEDLCKRLTTYRTGQPSFSLWPLSPNLNISKMLSNSLFSSEPACLPLCCFAFRSHSQLFFVRLVFLPLFEAYFINSVEVRVVNPVRAQCAFVQWTNR